MSSIKSLKNSSKTHFNSRRKQKKGSKALPVHRGEERLIEHQNRSADYLASMADIGHYKLLDPVIDAYHRSRLSTMLPPEGEVPIELGVLRLRTSIRAWWLHPDWVLRLRAVGLLPLARIVEVMWEDDQDRSPSRMSRRFPYEWTLLTALVDRWRSETHTFHLPCGEMAPTLQCLLPDWVALRCLPMVAYDILAT